MESIKLGQRYRTRDGRIVVIVRIADNVRYDDASYAAEYSDPDNPQPYGKLVWGDGKYAGCKNQDHKTEDDLVELISSAEFGPVQLSLFD